VLADKFVVFESLEGYIEGEPDIEYKANERHADQPKIESSHMVRIWQHLKHHC
jgi:hypothetical protein